MIQRRPRTTKKAQPIDYWKQWDKIQRDFDYTAKQALVELHILPDDYMKSDYFLMQTILQAEDPTKQDDAFNWMRHSGKEAK